MSGTKRRLPYGDYLKLMGLLTLASEHNKALADIERAAAGVVGAKDNDTGYFGHVTDAVYSNYDAASLCRALGIEVEEPTG